MAWLGVCFCAKIAHGVRLVRFGAFLRMGFIYWPCSRIRRFPLADFCGVSCFCRGGGYFVGFLVALGESDDGNCLFSCTSPVFTPRHHFVRGDLVFCMWHFLALAGGWLWWWGGFGVFVALLHFRWVHFSGLIFCVFGAFRKRAFRSVGIFHTGNLF